MVDRIEDRNDALLKERVYERGIHAVCGNIAYIAVIHILSETFHIYRRSFFCPYGVAVGSGKTYGIAAFGLKQGCDVLVAPSRIYHGDDLERFSVGDSPAFYHHRIHAHFLLHLACHDPSSMNQNLHSRHGCEVLDKLPKKYGIVHDIASYLDNLYHNPRRISFNTV